MNFKVYTSNIQRRSTLCIQSEKKKEGVSYFLGKEYDSSKGIGAEASRILETWVGIPGKTFSEAISFLIDFYDLKIKDVTDRPEDRCNLSYRQFEHYKNGEVKNPSKIIVIAICLSMKLPFTISVAIYFLAGFVFAYSFEDTMLLFLLEHFIGKTIEEINKELTKREQTPLTSYREQSF